MQGEQTEQPQGTSDVRSQAQKALESAKQESRELVGEAKERLAAEATTRKNRVAKELQHLGEALDRSADEMEQHDSVLTEPLRQAATFCTRSADSVSRKGTRELVSQVERFGREQPLLFFGAAMAAGFLTTRLLRSTTSKEEREPTEPIAQPSPEPLVGPEVTTLEKTEVTALDEQRTTTGAIQEQVPSPLVPPSEQPDLPGPMSGGPSEGNRPMGT